MERPDELKGDPEVQQIKAEISETQAELQHTVAEIQDRLSPAYLKDQATNSVREAATNVREATIGRMHHMMNRTNPIPYALIGIGAAWLLASNRSSQRQWNGGYRSGDSSWGGGPSQHGSTEYISSGDRLRSPYTAGSETDYSSGYSGAGYSGSSSSGSDYSGSGQSRTGEWQASAGEVADRARQVAHRARSRWDSMLDDNPMALGIAALAAGALVGAALPQTETENEYLGETRDQMVETAKSMAHDSVDMAKSVAKESVAKVTGLDT